MPPTADELTASVAKEAGAELDAALRKIKHCTGQLTDEQLWWRPAESMNSIANLILHLCGNLRQWAVSGIGGAKDVRDRPREFSEQGPIAGAELMQRLEQVVADAKAAFVAAPAAERLEVRRIQQFDVTGMQAIFQTVAHFRGHTQEIVHLTRSQLGDRYEFAFVPETPK